MVDVRDTFQRDFNHWERDGQEPHILAEGNRYTEHEQHQDAMADSLVVGGGPVASQVLTLMWWTWLVKLRASSCTSDTGQNFNMSGARDPHVSSSNSSSSIVRPRSSLSTEWWAFLLCSRDAVQKTVEIILVPFLGLVLDMPVAVHRQVRGLTSP